MRLLCGVELAAILVSLTMPAYSSRTHTYAGGKVPSGTAVIIILERGSPSLPAIWFCDLKPRKAAPFRVHHATPPRYSLRPCLRVPGILPGPQARGRGTGLGTEQDRVRRKQGACSRCHLPIPRVPRFAPAPRPPPEPEPRVTEARAALPYDQACERCRSHRPSKRTRTTRVKCESYGLCVPRRQNIAKRMLVRREVK